MNRLYRSVLVALLAFGISGIYAQGMDQMHQSSPKVDVGFETAGVVQALSQSSDNNALPNVPVGFQSAVGNIFVNADLTPGLKVYFELYLSSKHHEGYVMDREGYIYLSRLPEKYNVFGLNRIFQFIDLKAGVFEIDYGNWHLNRSDNGQVQKNPLIGNYIIDANTTEPGVEVIAHSGPIRGVVGLSTGTTTGDFKDGRGVAAHGKLGLTLKGLNVAGSFYTVDHTGNPTGYPLGGSYSALYAGNRSGSRYSGVMGGGPEVGQLAIGKGQQVTAYQVDASYAKKPVRLYGMYGVSTDADENGSAPGNPEETWNYYGIEGQWYVNPVFYLAARYNQANASKIYNLDSQASANRIQAGFGFWFTQQVLLKLEYVNQHYNDFPSGYNGLPAIDSNPRFSGLLSEFSVKF